MSVGGWVARGGPWPFTQQQQGCPLSFACGDTSTTMPGSGCHGDSLRWAESRGDRGWRCSSAVLSACCTLLTHTHTHARTHAHTHTHTRAHTHTRTHTHTRLLIKAQAPLVQRPIRVSNNHRVVLNLSLSLHREVLSVAACRGQWSGQSAASNSTGPESNKKRKPF